MSDQNIDQITQKDLLKLLFEQAQHNATREEVEKLDAKIDSTANKLDAKIDSTANKLDAKIESTASKLDAKIDSTASKLDAKIDSVRNELKSDIAKLDNRLWWIAGLIVVMAFKTEILAFFQ
ncbi:DUF1640 domain-containing protein [Vibrio coralliilyticus]|uniref:DUF1640 domain-containing protein n=1 Tax=Vibrio coralliilyticus TaxID=190893 RepID=UPI00182CF3FB|nr:DUF1640 domain-containing protein [Vibrio coralliilyticus]NUW66969.1 DUF1640 domain-containing protein [Vibrio coralliilyticus]